MAEPVADGTRVVGTLDSLPDTSFVVDFYANVSIDPSGYGEGERWVGSVAVMTDSLGHAAFDVGLPAIPVHQFVTATATALLGIDPRIGQTIGSTSEFSSARLIKATTVTTVTSTIDHPVYGEAVAFTALVGVTVPGIGPATGWVYFYDGATLLDSQPLDASG